MKRAISLTLAVMLTLLAACGEAPAPVSDHDGDGETSAATEAATETELKADVPDSDFGGYEFRVLARVGGWENYDISVESENGEVINDAIFKRNLAVSEKLNVKFKHIGAQNYDVKGPAQTAILAGSDEYDVILPSITDGATMAQAELLTPIQDLPYMDLTKPWYDQRCINELAINGKNYMFFSDITVANLDAIWIYVFNKQMIEDFKLDDPYDLVESGKWTTEKMTAMAKAVTSDVNGDSKMDKSDRWGLVAHDYVITAGYVGSGERIATADKNGEIGLTMKTERVLDVIDSLIGLQPYWIRYALTAQKFSTAAPVGFLPSDNYAELISVFTSGNALFMGECMSVMEDMRDSRIDFGVLPTPKLDEKQDGYYAAVNYIAAAMCIPKTVSDLERTSIILESWAAESSKTVIPAYYEVAMKGKYTRDVVSADMLDAILASRSYDLGIYYGWGQLSDRFCSLVYEGSTDFASMYASNEASALEAIKKFNGNA